MSKYIKLYPQRDVQESFKSDAKNYKKENSTNILKWMRILRIVIGSTLTCSLLVLAYKTDFFYFQKITQVLFIAGSILMIKYLSETKTKNTTN